MIQVIASINNFFGFQTKNQRNYRNFPIKPEREVRPSYKINTNSPAMIRIAPITAKT